jgi:hypothetical protein
MNSKDLFRQNYTPEPPPSRASKWLQAAAGVAIFAAIGVLLAWRG